MAALKIGKRRIKFRFFVFLSILVALVYYIWDTVKQPAAYAFISYGELMTEHQAQALIIREEEVFAAPAYGKVTYLSSDSETVEEGQLIATLYKENYDEETLYTLYNVQEKIMNYQRNSIVEKLLDSDYKKINNEIESVVCDIQSLIRTCDYPSIDNKEKELRSLMSRRQDYLDIRSQPDDYLQSLYEQESELLVRLKDWVVDINAPKAGIISYYIDGLENILGVSSVDKLNIDDFRQLINNPGNTKGKEDTAKAEQPFFKIADPNSSWFVVLETDGQVYFEKGSNVTVQVFADSEIVLNGVVYRVDKNKKSSLVILEFDSNVAPVINKRTLTLKITQTVEGFIVPLKALTKQKGKTGIKIIDRGSHIFIETSVKGTSDKYAVVAPVSLNQEINKNDRVILN